MILDLVWDSSNHIPMYNLVFKFYHNIFFMITFFLLQLYYRTVMRKHTRLSGTWMVLFDLFLSRNESASSNSLQSHCLSVANP